MISREDCNGKTQSALFQSRAWKCLRNHPAGSAGWFRTDRLELIGEKASVIFDNNVLTLIGDEEESIRLDLETAYQKSYDNAIAHFVDCLESGEPFETDRLDNLKSLQLVSDAYDLAGL